jgi:hypothetical protein
MRVHSAKECETLPGGSFGILTESASVPAVPERTGRDPYLSCLDDELGQEPVSLDLPEPPVPVGPNDGRGFGHDGERHACLVDAGPKELDVLRHTHDPVRIVPTQVRTDEALGHDRCIRRRNSGGLEHGPRQSEQSICGECWHLTPTTKGPGRLAGVEVEVYGIFGMPRRHMSETEGASCT